MLALIDCYCPSQYRLVLMSRRPNVVTFAIDVAQPMWMMGLMRWLLPLAVDLPLIERYSENSIETINKWISYSEQMRCIFSFVLLFQRAWWWGKVWPLLRSHLVHLLWIRMMHSQRADAMSLQWYGPCPVLEHRSALAVALEWFVQPVNWRRSNLNPIQLCWYLTVALSIHLMVLKLVRVC